MTSSTANVKHRVRTTGSEHQGQNSISDPDQNLYFQDGTSVVGCLVSALSSPSIHADGIRWLRFGKAIHSVTVHSNFVCLLVSSVPILVSRTGLQGFLVIAYVLLFIKTMVSLESILSILIRSFRSCYVEN